jgi:outer membrane receptor for ferrienterochelin and colicin
MNIKLHTLLFALSFILISALYSRAQDTEQGIIKGRVFGIEDKVRSPLSGAFVYWINTPTGTITDSEGKFELTMEGVTDKRLIASLTGFYSDTVSAEDKKFVFINLRSVSTSEIVVEDESGSNFISKDIVKTEVLTQNELKKAACCDLSGCFGSNSSVEVAVTDIVTNTKEMQILGLDGSYTQILIDGIPNMTGLTSRYGLSSIPGTLINKINISKGANSVLQGYESISGIINIELKDYASSERFLVNGYLNDMLEKQVNANYTGKWDKWSSIFSAHTLQESKRIDGDNDGFMDNPLTTRYMLYNKWKYDDSGKGLMFDAAVQYTDEEKTGGHKNFNKDEKGSSSVYGQTIDLSSLKLYSKFGKTFTNEDQLKGFISYDAYDELSYYGITRYSGKQTSFYTNIFYEKELMHDIKLKTGFSYRYEHIDEDINFTSSSSKTYAGVYNKKESVPGVFLENVLEALEHKLMLISGVRLDYHNTYHTVVTPRVLAKYEVSPETILRASFGTGFRTINLFNEYSNLFASGRDIIIGEELNPEKVINFGINLVRYFTFGDIHADLVIDYYKTNFINKIIPDYNSNTSNVVFQNLNGSAGSDIFQAETNFKFFNSLDVKASYKFNKVKYTQNGVEQDAPFIPEHKVLSNISYMFDENKWGVNLSMNWFGKQKLPNTAANPVEYRRPSESEPFAVFNAQLNKNWEAFEFYAGMENIFNYKQENPIISADNPFGQYFDTSFIWGPVKGREIYAGFRFKIMN